MHRVVLAPAGTPQEVVDQLTAAFLVLAEDKTFKNLMSRLSESIDIMGGPEYQELRESQSVAYQELVKDLTSQ